MGANICKCGNQQGINFQNIQTAHAVVCKKKKTTKQKVGRRYKQTFFQRRHTDGQKAHLKVLNTANYQRNANQNYNEATTSQGSEWPSLEKVFKQ